MEWNLIYVDVRTTLSKYKYPIDNYVPMPHNFAPQQVLDFLSDEGYNPYSRTRSDKIAIFVLQDLLHMNKKLREKAEAGEISYQISYNKFPTRASGANLVLGPVSRSVTPEDLEYPIANSEPDRVWFALDIEALMTKNQQNRGNCLKRLQSALLETQLVRHSIVVGGLLLTDTAQEVQFEHLDEVRVHEENVPDQVDMVIDDLDRMDERLPETYVMGSIVVDYDGQSAPELHEGAPAPSEDEKMHYEIFIRRLSNELDTEFLNLPDPQTDGPSDFISRGEGRTIDFKDPRASGDNIAKVAASMLNTEGGVILVGVDDNGDTTGISDPDQKQHDIANTLYNRLNTAMGDIIIERKEVDGDDVILIRLPQSQETLYEVNGKFYIRIGESKKPMTSEVIQQFFQSRFQQGIHNFFDE